MQRHFNLSSVLLTPWVFVLPVVFALLTAVGGHAAPKLGNDRLPPTNLLVFHGRSGEVKMVKSKADWEKRRMEILEGMQRIMGRLPGREKRVPLLVQTNETVDCGGYLRHLISYRSEPGSVVPAYLLVPRHAGSRVPGILALHPTEMQFGHRVVIEQMGVNYRAYGRDLAERGYVVLAPAYPLMANYQPDLQALGYSSGTMKAIWDNIRGLDLLQGLPCVQTKQLGAIGHSLGGHNAIYTAVFDSRIRVVVSSCGFDSFVDYQQGNIKGWTSDRYMPRLLEYKDRLAEIPFDFYELIGALAPRRVFVNAPKGDANFDCRSVEGIVRAAMPVYRLYGAPGRLEVEHPDCAHDFPPEIREKAYRTLEEELGPGAR